jgi:hypothetical protein
MSVRDMSAEHTRTLMERLDRVYRLCEEARGKPLHISVVLLAHHKQAEGVRSALESLTLNGLPGGTMLDIFVMVMPDENGSRGAVGEIVSKIQSSADQSGDRTIHVLDAERPYHGIHCLFPYGRTVHKGIDAALELVKQTGRTVNHVIVRVSGDVIISDRGILAKLAHPLNDPAFSGVVVSSAVQDSDWDKDEFPRRLVIKPRMLAFKADPRQYIPCEASTPSGSMSAYMAPMFTEVGISRTWGGGEDGVGFSLLDSRLKGIVVRDAAIYHCHAGRSLVEQFLSFGDWLYTGPINKLNHVSARRGIDQTDAYEYFMTQGVLTDASRLSIDRLGSVFGVSLAIHFLRLRHSLKASAIMLGGILWK